MSGALGSTVNATPVKSVIGDDNQQHVFQSLLNFVMHPADDGSGQFQFSSSPSYQGALVADTNNTMLPGVWSSWQPWNSGTEYMANQLYAPKSKGGLGIGEADPTLSKLQQYGSAGGPGGQGQSNLLQFGTTLNGPGAAMVSSNSQYGTPTDAAGQPVHSIMQYGTPSSGALGQMMSSLAQFGAAGPAGLPLNAIAQGQQTGAAQYLAPFLQGNRAAPYQAPPVNINPVLRAQN